MSLFTTTCVILAMMTWHGENCVQKLEQRVQRVIEYLDATDGYEMRFTNVVIDANGRADSSIVRLLRKNHYRELVSKDVRSVECSDAVVIVLHQHKSILVRDASTTPSQHDAAYMQRHWDALRRGQSVECRTDERGDETFTVRYSALQSPDYDQVSVTYDINGDLLRSRARYRNKSVADHLVMKDFYFGPFPEDITTPTSALSVIYDHRGALRPEYRQYSVHDVRASRDPRLSRYRQSDR